MPAHARRLAIRFAVPLLLAWLPFGVAQAASSAASSASESGSASIGSVSNSLGHSSDSSSKNDRVAQGDYRVEEVARDESRPGLLRLTLQAVDRAGADGRLYLYLPPAAAANGQVAEGRMVTATPRPYGVEFARADTREAFFLVLADAWFDDLSNRPVTL